MIVFVGLILIFGLGEGLWMIANRVVEVKHNNTVENILQIQIELLWTNNSPWFVNLAHDLL